jgi:hypothetical protein
MVQDAKYFIKSALMLNESTLEITFQDEVLIDLEAIKLIDVHCDEIVAGRRLKRLVVSGKKTLMTKEARQYGQDKSKSSKDLIIAEAVVVNTLPQKMVANFYFAFIRDFYPAKFFTDINKAKDWLSGF